LCLANVKEQLGEKKEAARLFGIVLSRDPDNQKAQEGMAKL
jgi:hypothetical protein